MKRLFVFVLSHPKGMYIILYIIEIEDLFIPCQLLYIIFHSASIKDKTRKKSLFFMRMYVLTYVYNGK